MSISRSITRRYRAGSESHFLLNSDAVLLPVFENQRTEPDCYKYVLATDLHQINQISCYRVIEVLGSVNLKENFTSQRVFTY